MQTAMKITPQVRQEIVSIIDERIREVPVTKEDFSELKAIVRDIAETQKELAEAYRQLPGYLQEHFQIVLIEKMVRLELEGEEVHLFARGKKNGKDLLVVGEAELRLSNVGKLRQLEKKVALVKKTYPGDCIPLLITHFARPQVLEAARERGIIVVQSFEW